MGGNVTLANQFFIDLHWPTCNMDLPDGVKPIG